MLDDSAPLADAARIAACEEILGHAFRDRDLLETCLTHASVARTRLSSNERLEFLGDAVLGLVVCDLLYRRFPEASEGELTRIKSVVVSRTTCAEACERLELDRCLLLGKGLTVQETVPGSVLAAGFESLVAGLFLDGGLSAAARFVEQALGSALERAAIVEQSGNFKSQLQQLVQKVHGETPQYRVLDEKGPDHSKCFLIAATIGEHLFAGAWGTSKKEAEQRAARNALLELRGDPVPVADA
jgi:ribonuclease-3